MPDEFSADSAQLGSLIVNGAARFTNDVFADTFTGNLVGTASNAVKVGNNLVIKLNGGSTEGTNLFTYNGSAAKTINITASSIGAQASGTYAGGISNGGAASKLAYQSGNEINFVTNGTLPYIIHFNWKNGYTNAKTGTSSDISYYFENYNCEYNHTTLYAAQFSGNAATATTATKVGKSLKMANSKSFDGSAEVSLFTNDLIPAISKTYESTSYYATANSWDETNWYFMSVKPDSWYQTWRVKFKIRSHCPGYTNVDSTSWVEIYGRVNSATSVKIFNEFYDRGHYYIPVYPLT